MKTSKSWRNILRVSPRRWRRRRSRVSSARPSGRRSAGAAPSTQHRQELRERPVIRVAILFLAESMSFVFGLQVPDHASAAAQTVDDLFCLADRYARIVLAVDYEQRPRNALR